MSLEELYTKTFAKEVGYFTHWLPSAEISLGTVGYLDGQRFIPKSTLQDMGIAFDPLKDIVEDNAPSSMEFTSNKGVSITVQMAADTKQSVVGVPVGEAGIGVQFSKEGAFVLRAEKAFEPRIRDVHRIESDIVSAFKAGKWPRAYVVVTQLWHAPYMDALISEDSNSSLDLKLDAASAATMPQLGDASAKLSVVRTNGKVMKLLACQHAYPAFVLAGLKSSRKGKAWNAAAMHADGFEAAGEQFNDEGAESYSLSPIHPDDVEI